MTAILDIIKGVVIGVANIIPGVSGGTMAVSLGIYDKIIAAVSNLFRDWKASVKTLLPLLVGCALGIVGFTYAIEFLLSKHTFVTCMAFVGLILGGLPALFAALRAEIQKTSGQRKRTFPHAGTAGSDEASGSTASGSSSGAASDASSGAAGFLGSIGISGILAFAVLFCVAVFLPMLNADEEVLRTFTAAPTTLLALFCVGIIASATMVIPGVSGSLVMMILGYYYGIINTIKSFLEALRHFDIGGMFSAGILLLPFGIGVLLGIFLIARLITFLFEKYGVATYCAILGLIIASPFAIFYNTGLFGQLGSLTAGQIVLGLVLAVGCGIFTYVLGNE